MTEEQKTNGKTDETGDSWVTLGSFWSTRRAPGIDHVPDTTYVAPPNRIQRRTLVVGSAILLGSLAIGAALVIAGTSDDGSGGGDSEVSAAATLTSTSTRPAGSTTTTTPTTAPPSPPSTTLSPPPTTRALNASIAPAPRPAPTPPATANPALAPYQPVPVPPGVSATLTAGSCSWQGGTLHSAGTITSTSASGRTWTVTMSWLQNNRVLAQQSLVVGLAPAESKPWNLSVGLSAPPADLACYLAIT